MFMIYYDDQETQSYTRERLWVSDERLFATTLIGEHTAAARKARISSIYAPISAIVTK